MVLTLSVAERDREIVCEFGPTDVQDGMPCRRLMVQRPSDKRL